MEFDNLTLNVILAYLNVYLNPCRIEFNGSVAWHKNSSDAFLIPIEYSVLLYTLNLITAREGAHIKPKSKLSSHAGFKAFLCWYIKVE